MLVALTALFALAQEPAAVDWGTVLSSGVEGELVAVVDGVPVTAAEWQERAARAPTRTRQEVLDDLVQEKLLLLSALRGGVLAQEKVQKVLVNTLLREQVYVGFDNDDFSEAELQAYFTAHAEEFAVPEKRQIKRIFIADSKDARKKAKDVHKQLQADPTRFAEVATEISEDPYRRRGGDLGFMTREGKPGVPDEVVATAWALKVGGLSEPFEADGGWNIVMVANQRDRVERTFEQMKGSVLRRVKNERYVAARDAYVAALRAKARVETFPDRLEALEIPAPPKPLDVTEPEAPSEDEE